MPLPRGQAEPEPEPEPEPQFAPLPRGQAEPEPEPEFVPLPRGQAEPEPEPEPQFVPLPRGQAEPEPLNAGLACKDTPMFDSLLAVFNWNLNPILLDLGPLQIRYYGVMFALTIYTGFAVWRRQALKNGESHQFAESFLWYGVIAIVAGARLGHVFFYEPVTYLKNPIEIIKFWKGGLASHGATVGIAVAVWLFSRNYKSSFYRVADYLAPAIAIAAGGVRIGNFFNSEIVGRVTDVPWAVVFERYDNLPRHPSQLYEFMMGVVTYFVVMAVEKKDIRRAGSGLMAGVFLIVYFSFRFTVEFFKEFQTEQLRQGGLLGGIENAIGFHFTMGQWLSVIPVLAGIAIFVRALRQPKDAIALPKATPDTPEQAAAEQRGAAVGAGKGRKR